MSLALRPFTVMGYDADLAQRVERSRGLIARTVSSILFKHEDVEDAIQEVNIRLLQKGDSAHTSWVAFVVSTARNCCVDLMRKQKVRKTVTFTECVAKYDASANGFLDASGTFERSFDERFGGVVDPTDDLLFIESIMARLEPDDQQMFHMVADGATFKQIAEALNSTVPSVKSRFYRLRRRLSFFADRENTGALVNREEC